jgi:hypothetical protein
VTVPTVVEAVQVPPSTPVPTVVAGVKVGPQSLPKTGDPLVGLLRLLGVALIGLGLTVRVFTRKE